MRSLRVLGTFTLVSVAMLLSGCAIADAGGQSDGESAKQADAFSEVYAQTIDWGACGEDFGLNEEFTEKILDRGASQATLDALECATITAPLDWKDPANGETIELAVTHLPATGGEKIGTLFGNPGGPGSSGLDYTYSMLASPGFDQVYEQYDLIGFDPRGIGRSTPVECEDVSSIREVQLATCAEDFPLARSMGTSQVARDMDLLRALQGEETLNYLGYSYGTILGSTYVTLFPERSGRVVLDSAPDATWASPTGHFDQSVAMAREIVAMVEGCGTLYSVDACPVNTEDALLEKFAELNETPLVATDGTELNGGLFHGYLMTGLYGRDAKRVTVLDTAGRALGGDQDGIDDIVRDMASGGASVSMAGQLVSCHSAPKDPNIVGLLEDIEEKGMPKLLGGPEISDETIAPFADLSCGAIAESGDDLVSFTAPKDNTVLVIGITGDHATPFENGKNLAAELGNTRFLTFDGHGHGASYTGRSACIDDATTAFLLNNELPEEGKVCLPN